MATPTRLVGPFSFNCGEISPFSQLRTPSKMKFSTSDILCSTAGRLATLSQLRRQDGVAMETPCCLLYTRSGSAPNLSHPLLTKIQGLPAVTQVPLPTIVESSETLEAHGQGVAAFTGRPEAVICSCIQDPASRPPTGYNDKNSVSVWAPGGRKKLTLEGFLAVQETLQADLMEALYDGDTPNGSSTKRLQKSVDRSLAFLDQCLAAKLNKQKLEKAEVLGVVVGGDSLAERLRSARETAQRPVSGFVLDGLHTGSMEEEARWSIMAAVLRELPEDKPRFLPAVGRPDEILRAVELGVDIFDSAFPYEVTERGCALVFLYSIPQSNTSASRDAEASRVQGGNQQDGGCAENGDLSGQTAYELNLSDKRFVDDFSAVVEGCQCYCCTNHTRAYLNHLLNVKELLAGVLLMIHNFHHYFAFFGSVRQALRQGTMDRLRSEVNKTR